MPRQGLHSMRITSKLLKRIVLEEMDKMKPLATAEEVDADEFADSLEKKIDYVKALKIEETRLLSRLRKIREQKVKTIKSI
jgi:hypothetical protein